MKKLLILICFGLLLAGGIFGAGYYNEQQVDRMRSIEIKQQPEAQATKDEHETDHHNPALGDDPAKLPQVDLTKTADVTIEIKNGAYKQPNIKIKKGTTVTWINQDTTEHNTMRSHDGEEHAHDAPEPDQVRDDLFAGPLLQKGESYSFTFTKTGSLYYHSAPSPLTAGTITVVE